MHASDAPPKGFAAALLAPITLLYLFCLLAPISYFLAVSFLRYSPTELYTSTPTLENYARLLSDAYNVGVIAETFAWPRSSRPSRSCSAMRSPTSCRAPRPPGAAFSSSS